MYDNFPSFVIGYHGCDRSLAEKVFAGKARLKPSQNDYDWLGHGAYFWESNPQRALDYAEFLRHHPNRSQARIHSPAVIGAIIDLGLCLNLLDSHFIDALKDAYQNLKEIYQKAGTEMPVNKSLGGSSDLLLRRLDCAVIERLHAANLERGLAPFDSTRGVFVEGPPAYPGAGVHDASHIQICVRNPRSIKGYFRVLPELSD